MPDTVDGWIEVSQERGVDANLLKREQRHLAALYMIGYAVESKLKALLQSDGTPFPTSGSEGHHLRGLWDAAGFRPHDLLPKGKSFMRFWNTDLRYAAALNPETDVNTLYLGAVELAGWIQKRIRRQGARRR